MRFLDILLGRVPARVPVPAGTTAVIGAVMFEGGPPDNVALTGYPAFLGDDGNGRAQVRIGTGPGACMTITTPDARYCALMAAAFMDACDSLQPVPPAMSRRRP